MYTFLDDETGVSGLGPGVLFLEGLSLVVSYWQHEFVQCLTDFSDEASLVEERGYQERVERVDVDVFFGAEVDQSGRFLLH